MQTTIITTALAVLFAALWLIELRFARKERKRHELELENMRSDHTKTLARERSNSWVEGVQAAAKLRARLRDKAGRFA